MHLPGQPHASTVRSATRILLRHGYLRQDGDFDAENFETASDEPAELPEPGPDAATSRWGRLRRRRQDRLVHA